MNTYEVFGRKYVAIYNQRPKYAKQTISLLVYDSTSEIHKYNLGWFYRLVEKITTFVMEFQHNG